MRIATRLAAAFVAVLVGQGLSPAQNYRIERIASGLNQPTYVTQAPGDPTNILYYTERTSNTLGGAFATNAMGKVWRYDVDAQTRSLVLDLSSRSVTLDTGLQTIAFSPGFNTPGAPGYQKMYVSSSERGSTARNRVEEYELLAGAATLPPKTILQYDNNRDNNHTVNWIGFDPTATGDALGYLYISTGDGSFGNFYGSATSTTGRPSQNPSDIAGKILRVDIDGGDAYPADALKNFGIPSSNPVPTFNAANPGTPLMGAIRVSGAVTPASALGEAWVTGVRNGYRASFDRATGDFWYGDVGETAREEINFLKTGSNASGPPVDHGWPQREGVIASNIRISNAVDGPHEMTNPFTNVTALNPIHNYSHGVGLAVMGGYVYHGPIAELQGKYFFADFAGTGKLFSADFDRNTNPASYNGANATVTEMSATWQSLVVDPRNPSYLPSSGALDLAGLDHIVSFGEDNAGNVYLVDFGNRSGSQNPFDGQYPAAGLGEIFRLTPIVALTLTVDRDTGAVMLRNDGASAIGIRGYTIASSAGAIIDSMMSPITGNFDAPPSGNGDFDPNDVWQITSPVGDLRVFREASLGDGDALAVDEELVLSAADAWRPSIYEDVTLHVTLTDGTLALGSVTFVGNGGEAYARSDLDANGALDLADWHEFIENHLGDLDGLPLVDQYYRGDVDGDGDNDFADFRLFQADFDAANGPGALAAALAEVPEPSTTTMALLAAAGMIRRRRGMGFAPLRRYAGGCPTQWWRRNQRDRRQCGAGCAGGRGR